MKPNIYRTATARICAAANAIMAVAGIFDELLCIAYVYRQQRGGQVLVALADSDRSCFLPVCHDGVDTARLLFPELRQGLQRRTAAHGPEAHPRGVGALPAVAHTSRISIRRREIDIQLGLWAIIAVHSGIIAWLDAPTKHIAHAASLNIGLVHAHHEVRHGGRRLLPVAVQEIRRVGLAHPLLVHHTRPPNFRHENEVFCEGFLRSQVPVPEHHLVKGAAFLQRVDELLRVFRGSTLRDARDLPQKPAAPNWVLLRGCVRP
mmetsp:Transcript_61971/g.145316  ORF Transcript_61971/g.145316 Transcript_61971/m.145316 type:complete len:262 (+) Transcript_61971:839-1624(+)